MMSLLKVLLILLLILHNFFSYSMFSIARACPILPLRESCFPLGVIVIPSLWSRQRRSLRLYRCTHECDGRISLLARRRRSIRNLIDLLSFQRVRFGRVFFLQERDLRLLLSHDVFLRLEFFFELPGMSDLKDGRFVDAAYLTYFDLVLFNHALQRGILLCIALFQTMTVSMQLHEIGKLCLKLLHSVGMHNILGVHFFLSVFLLRGEVSSEARAQAVGFVFPGVRLIF
jgi:hypothetical protein